MRRERGKTIRIDADREGGRARASPEGGQFAAAQIDSSGELGDTSKKGAHAVFGLEADEVVGAQRLHHRFVARQRDQHLRRRERRVEEETDAVGDAELAQLLTEWDQMVVMHPDEIIGLDQGCEYFGEAPIDIGIDARRIAPIFHQAEAEMKERPQRPVGMTQIIELVLGRREIDGRIGNLAARRETRRIGRLFDDFAAPAEPDAAALAQGLAHGNAKAARPRVCRTRKDQPI